MYVDSSRVAAIRYVPYDPNDAESGVGTVFVRFHKYNDPWAYYDVPFSIYNEFVTASSVGRYINAQMNSYNYNRASASEVDDYFDTKSTPNWEGELGLNWQDSFQLGGDK